MSGRILPAMRTNAILLSLGTTLLLACGAAEKPVATATPCPTAPTAPTASAPSPAPSVVASAAPSAEPVDPTVTRSVVGDAQCLRYSPGYPEYLGLRCVLATGPSGHPEFVFRSLTNPKSFLRVETAHSTVEGIDKDLGLRAPRSRIFHLVDCVDDALVKEPNLAGTIIVSYEVGKSGVPEKVKLGEGTLKSKAVSACATAWVSKLRVYPAPETPGKVTFVAAFRSSSVATNEEK